MHNLSLNSVLYMLTMFGVLFLIKPTTAQHQHYRNVSSSFSETGRRFEQSLHFNLLEKSVSDVKDPPTELYNVTFTDINGQDILVIFNMTQVNEWSYDEYIPFNEKAREDAFVITSPAENPSSVMLISMKDNKTLCVCSGSLLTPQWVLTAAHCSEIGPKPDAMLVFAGIYSLAGLSIDRKSLESQIAKSTEFYAHPNFDQRSDADVLVVKVRPFNLTKTINIVSPSTEPWNYYSYKECKFTGFGRVQMNVRSKDDEVRKTHKILAKKPCLCSFMLKKSLGNMSASRYICSKPQEDHGLCPGDSGGGLICDGQVRAIAVQIIQMHDVKTCDMSDIWQEELKCGSGNTLTVFQDICPFLPWINSYVKLFNETEISPKCVYIPSISTTHRSNIFLFILYIVFVVLASNPK